MLLILFALVFLSVQLLAANQPRINWTSGSPSFNIPTGDYFQNLTAANGGAISIVGVTNFTLSGTSVTFLKNSATGSNGGAIFIQNSQGLFNVTTAYFLENSASAGGQRLGGGGINMNNSNVTFQGQYLKFEKNSAIGGSGGAGGGGIHAHTTSRLTLRTSTVIFENNYSAQDGASFLIRDSIFDVTQDVDYMYMINNIGGIGPGMYLRGNATVNINPKRIYISNNIGTDGGTYGGGAMMLYNPASMALTFGNASNSQRTQIIISKNTAQSYGGMSLVQGTAEGNGTVNLTFVNSNIEATSNTAVLYYGGIIAVKSGIALISFNNSNSTFIGNTARLGGSIYLGGNANSKVTFDGGSIYFTSNASLAANSEGNIAIISGSMEIKNLTNMIGKYNRAASGGFLYIPNNIGFTFSGQTLEMSSNVAFGNGISGGGYGRGGAFYFNGTGNITFSGNDMKFLGNTASSGAVLYALGGKKVEFTGTNANAQFIANITTVGYGVISWAEAGTEVRFSGLNSLIAKWNRSRAGGGFLYINGAQYVLDSRSIDISSNGARDSASNISGDGGAIYLLNS
ncbi:MAG: hypothetical protein LBV16_01335, partial [Elusimicrobiota bacterium]|nr:hypothetical protein [Elusimicrobiota bacterium]